MAPTRDPSDRKYPCNTVFDLGDIDSVSFLAAMIHRRLLWFTVPSQAVQVLPLFALAHAVELVIRMLGGGIFPGWILLLAPLAEALLWPVVSILLLVPQRRAPDRDENRPL